MNAQTRTIGSNTIDLDSLLELQIDALNNNSNATEPSGPPGYLAIDLEANETSQTGPIGAHGLPFLNLDPYNLDGKDNLPSGELQEGPQGFIGSEIQSSNGAGEQQLGFGLEMENFIFRTDDEVLEVMALTEERVTEIKTMNVNGEMLPVEYQNGLAYHFEGSLYDTQFRQLYVTMDAEVATTIQTEGFDENGNLTLTGFGYEQMLNVEGQAFDYGIEEFIMEFELMVDIQRGDHGVYEMNISVLFEGEIVYLNGSERQYLFEDEMNIWFRDLDELMSHDSIEFSQGLYDEIARFANGMGEAWDAFGTFNDQLEAILLQLREDGHYQAWDDADQGLDNPFDYNLPNMDPFA